MPKLWTQTLQEHRRAVHDATLDTTAALVHQHGLAAVTMSKIAAQTGIGRATLYKYFPDVEAILIAWHERQIGRHLRQLAAARDRAGPPGQRLEAVLTTYALIQHQHHDTQLAALLHRGEHIIRARRQLHDFITGLIADGAAAGDIRDDAAPAELATYCLHALTAAGTLPSPAAVHRLLTVTLAGLRPAASPGDPRDARKTASRPAKLACYVYDGTNPGDDRPVIGWRQPDGATADIARPGQSCVAAH